MLFSRILSPSISKNNLFHLDLLQILVGQKFYDSISTAGFMEIIYRCYYASIKCHPNITKPHFFCLPERVEEKLKSHNRDLSMVRLHLLIFYNCLCNLMNRHCATYSLHVSSFFLSLLLLRKSLFLML